MSIFFILLNIAVALPHVNISPTLFNSVIALKGYVVLFYLAALSYIALDNQAIKTEIDIYTLNRVGLYIPWHNTRSLLNGVEGLKRMFESLPLNSPVRLFIEKNCTHLMKPIEGNTGIPIAYVMSSVLNTLPDVVKLGTTYKSDQFKHLLGEVAVYVFYLDNMDKPTQCGSSIRLKNRIRTHYLHARKNLIFFKNVKIEEFKWVPVKYSNNYVAMFRANNIITSSEEEIIVKKKKHKKKVIYISDEDDNDKKRL